MQEKSLACSCSDPCESLSWSVSPLQQVQNAVDGCLESRSASSSVNLHDQLSGELHDLWFVRAGFMALAWRSKQGHLKKHNPVRPCFALGMAPCLSG